MLYGDRLVARLDPRLERSTKTLHINGFWLEDHAPVGDPAFTTAFARGLRSFVRFVEAERVQIAAIDPDGLRKKIAEALEM